MGLPQGWQTPKTDWTAFDVLTAAALNRIEGNIRAIEEGIRTINDNSLPTSNTVPLSTFIDNVASLIKAITGKSSWRQPPSVNLEAFAGLDRFPDFEMLRRWQYHCLAAHTKFERITTLSLTGVAKFSGAVMANYWIVFIPNSASYVMLWSPKTGETKTIDVILGSNKWRGAAVVGNKVFCAPYDAENILVIDVSEYTVSYLSHPDVGTTSGKFWGAVAKDKKVYFIPHNAITVLYYDTETQNFGTIGNLTGNAKWAGGALAVERIFCAPYDSASVLIIDTTNNTVSTTGSLAGSGKCIGAAANPWETFVVFAPFNHNVVRTINTSTLAISGPSISASSQVSAGIIPLANGGFVCVPYNHSKFIYVTPDLGTATEIDTGLTASAKYMGGCLYLDGTVYFAPYDETYPGRTFAVKDYTVYDARI
ncbi:MAG: hypothetical protein QXR93_06050 [Archaeoglobaceae archaeon]